VPLCSRCGQDNPDGFRFCGACAARLETEERREERKVVTVFFADIVGSTARAEQLDPEDVRAMLAPYYARARSEIERFGGTVEKFIGDAVVALFGAPAAHEDDPERAVRAAFAVRDAVADLNAADAWLDLHIRIGVNTGEALVVLGARATEGEGMAAGDVMNTAARLQSAAPVDGILVGEATCEATADAIEYRVAEPVQAKGKSEPLRVWEAVAARHVPSRRAPSRVPLVGRKEELAVLTDVWRQVREERRPGLATVLGAPGTGKSRLLIEFAARAEPAAVYWGRCLSYGEGITYWPVTEILRDAAGILVDDDERAISAKLGALLEGLSADKADELRTMAAALANLMGVPITPLGTYSAGEITQAELHWGIRRVLQLLASRHPLVLVFEDLHWAEPTLLELLLSIVAMTEDAPVLVLGSSRPELAENWPAVAGRNRRRRVVELETLSGTESRALVAGLLEAEGARPGRVDTLIEAVGGNPLFLEETVHMLVDAGVLEAPDDELAARVDELGVPSSLQALIGSRLDQLTPAEKRLAQNASVVGAVFWPGAVVHLNGLDGDVSRGLEALERHDFIRAQEVSTVEGEQEYAFKHILIRDVAYGQLPKGRRVGLHVRFADWITALPRSKDELIEIVAYHLEQACLIAREVARVPEPPPVLRAAEALLRSAEKTERREGLREADRFYARALMLLGDEHGDQRAGLRLRRGRTLIALGDIRAAREEFDAVMKQAAGLDRTDLECAALIELGDIDERQGRFGDARRRVVRAQELAARLGDPLLHVRASFVFAQLRADFVGALDEAVDELKRVVAIAENVNDRALGTEGHLRIATLFMNLGRLREAEEELNRCLELAREMGSHRFEAEATAWLGAVKYNQGRLEEAERLGLQARDWLERTGDTYFQVQNLVRPLALLALARDDLELAERWMKEAIPIALEIGGWVVAETYRYLTLTLVRQGRIEDAEQLTRFAATEAREEDPYARAVIAFAEATVATGRGDRAMASNRYQEAIRLFEKLSTPVDLAETRLAFAKALQAFGDAAGARAQLERARELCADMDADGLLAQIRGLLTAIGRGAGPAGPLIPA
jgi:class 3 adenylate cyclase/tetratricopeptide (TPR) repeat protein